MEERAGARSAADRAFTEYEAGHWAEAADLLQRAESLVHSPMHLLFLARSQVQMGLFLQAKENYLAIGRETLGGESPASFARAKADARRELQALEPRIPRVTLVVHGAPAQAAWQLEMDGYALPGALVGIPHPVNPGAHTWTVALAANPREPVAMESREVPEAGEVAVSFDLSGIALEPVAAMASAELADEAVRGEAAGGSGWMLGAYAGFAVGAIGTGIGIGYLLELKNAESSLENCVGNECPATDDNLHADRRIRNAETGQLLGFGLGALGIGAGIALWLLSPDAERSGASHEAPVRLVVGPGSASVVGTF